MDFMKIQYTTKPKLTTQGMLYNSPPYKEGVPNGRGGFGRGLIAVALVNKLKPLL